MKNDFLHSTNGKFLIKIQGNSINVTLYKFIISVKGGHCAYLPWKPANLDMSGVNSVP
jgi:hypothetical protein